MRLIGDGGHAKVVREMIARVMHVEPLPDTFALIAVGDNAARKREAEAHPELQYPVLRHDSAIVAQSALLANGTIIMAGVIVQSNVNIGKHVILNTGCVVDHDCVIGDYAHIAPGAHLCGGVHVGEGSLVGVGVGIAPNTVIPPWSLVKAARLDIVPLSGS